MPQASCVVLPSKSNSGGVTTTATGIMSASSRCHAAFFGAKLSLSRSLLVPFDGSSLAVQGCSSTTTYSSSSSLTSSLPFRKSFELANKRREANNPTIDMTSVMADVERYAVEWSHLKSAEYGAKLRSALEEMIDAIIDVCYLSTGRSKSRSENRMQIIANKLNLSTDTIKDVLFKSDPSNIIAEFHKKILLRVEEEKESSTQNKKTEQLFLRFGITGEDNPLERAKKHMKTYFIGKFVILISLHNLSDGFFAEFVMTNYLWRLAERGIICGTMNYSEGFDSGVLYDSRGMKKV